MYFGCGKRPDITFAVDQLSKHNANPRNSYLRAAKRVVGYLKGIMQMGLIFGKEVKGHLPRNPPPYDLIGYPDNNFARDPKDSKSVMGYASS